MENASHQHHKPSQLRVCNGAGCISAKLCALVPGDDGGWPLQPSSSPPWWLRCVDDGWDCVALAQLSLKFVLQLLHSALNRAVLVFKAKDMSSTRSRQQQNTAEENNRGNPTWGLAKPSASSPIRLAPALIASTCSCSGPPVW